MERIAAPRGKEDAMPDYTVTITIVQSITAGSEETAQKRADLLSEAYGKALAQPGFPKGKWLGDQEECSVDVEEA